MIFRFYLDWDMVVNSFKKEGFISGVYVFFFYLIWLGINGYYKFKKGDVL